MQNFQQPNGDVSARGAMSNFILTSNDELKKTEDYKKVSDVIFRLMETGVTHAARGYCVSMSDIVYTMLTQLNIPCKIVECGLTIDIKSTNQLYVVGYDNLKDKPDGADTHVVVVTQTEIPMIIDVSISHLLPNRLQGVIDSCCVDSNGVIANINNGDVYLTYKEKKKFTLPMMHQLSIVDRIKTDVSIFNNIKFIKSLVVVALCISTINAARGLYDFYTVHVVQDNYWGPSAIKVIDDKVNRIIEKLDKK